MRCNHMHHRACVPRISFRNSAVPTRSAKRGKVTKVGCEQKGSRLFVISSSVTLSYYPTDCRTKSCSIKFPAQLERKINKKPKRQRARYCNKWTPGYQRPTFVSQRLDKGYDHACLSRADVFKRRERSAEQATQMLRRSATWCASDRFERMAATRGARGSVPSTPNVVGADMGLALCAQRSRQRAKSSSGHIASIFLLCHLCLW